MTKSSYRKTYVPLTELKTRTSLQYNYSWNTCENDLAVHVEPAKTYENPHHKGQNQIACKKPLSCDRLTEWIKCRSTNRPELIFNLYDERKHIPTVIYNVRTYSSPHYSYHTMYIRPVTICNGIQNMWYARIQHNGHRLRFIYHIEVDSVLFVARVLVCTVRNFVQPVTTCDDMQNIW